MKEVNLSSDRMREVMSQSSNAKSNDVDEVLNKKFNIPKIEPEFGSTF